MKIRYGKPYGDVAAFKQNFISDNEEFLRQNEGIEKMYLLGSEGGL